MMQFLRTLWGLLNHGWVSSCIGLVGLVAALLIYRSSRIGARLVYQRRTLRLIGKGQSALPEEVEILFQGTSVPRLASTHIVLWNSGTALLRGDAVVDEDPLKFAFENGSQIVRARILRANREANKVMVSLNPMAVNEVLVIFDYLEPGDGVVIELLHTSEARYPTTSGTIRCVPRGIVNWGPMSRKRSMELSLGSLSLRVWNRTAISILGILIGLIMTMTGLGVPHWITRIFPTPETADTQSIRWVVTIAGLVYMMVPSFGLWLNRRRFPKSLLCDEIEG